MKLQRIRYFVTLAETLSFSRTADICYVSQTTVSQQIRALEAELGCELFARTKRKVELTAAGRLYLDDARRALELLDHADERVRLFKAAEPLELKLALADGVAPGYAAPLLRAFKEENPGVALECTYCRAHDLFARIVAGRVDVGLTLDLSERGGRFPADVDVTPAGTLAQYVVVEAGSPLARHAHLTRDQLKGERFVNALESLDVIPRAPQARVPEGNPAPAACDSPAASGAEHTDVVVENMDALLLAVSLGAGYTLLSEPMVQALAPGLNLAAVPLSDERVGLVACRLRGCDSPAVGRFLAFVSKGR